MVVLLPNLPLADISTLNMMHGTWPTLSAASSSEPSSIYSGPTVVADAELVAKSIRQYIPLFRPSVIMNGIDTERFQPGQQSMARDQLSLPKDVPIIGCAARLTAVKAHNILISAFSQLPNHIHLALAGGGELEEELKKLAQSLNVSDRVHFLGVVDDMPTFFHALDVFCLASMREGLPLSPLEAQACGRILC